VSEAESDHRRGGGVVDSTGSPASPQQVSVCVGETPFFVVSARDWTNKDYSTAVPEVAEVGFSAL
jgi:hypothetical protein